MNETIKYLEDNLKNETVVVAVSGGPDSMALLKLVNDLKDKNNLNIVCAHVNHKLRTESEAEAVMVKDFCDQNGISFEYMTIDTYNDDNFHNDARIKRYDFFEKSVKKCQAKHLLTAHHGDDLMETILMRIVRGSTLKGYAGFMIETDKGDYKILRPLIFYTKDEILNYVNENKIPYAVDQSNEKTVYTRNRFRKYVLPPLKDEDANVHQKFYKFSKTLELYNHYIEKEVNIKLKEIYINNVLDIKKFKTLDKVIQIKVINTILENMYQDDLMLITDKHTEIIYDLLLSDKANQTIFLPNNYKGIKAYDTFEIVTDINNSGYNYELSEYVLLPNNHELKIIEETESNSNFICRLNTNETGSLYIRTRHDGDKMEVKGLEGSKKVKDIFINEKVPIIARDTWPILVNGNDEVIWLPGLKKSKFDKQKQEKYDIIVEYH